MRLVFLGTCAGTEPVAGFRHSSIAVESGGNLYFFDAGEGCSYSAHLLGLDLLATRAIFLSHAHMDHVGGLPNLLWNIRKLESLPGSKGSLRGRRIDVLCPDERLLPAVRSLLACTEGGFSIDFALVDRRAAEGPLFDDGELSVEAFGNRHLPRSGSAPLSLSFKFAAGGRKVVYSGDLGDVTELAPLLPGADLAIVETGHHSAERVCALAAGERSFQGRLCFSHHGRAILADFAGELAKARGVLGERVLFAKDGFSLEL